MPAGAYSVPMLTPRWPVVLFDLDGTLADTIGLIVASYNHAFRQVMGTERDEAEIRAWIGRPLLELRPCRARARRGAGPGLPRVEHRAHPRPAARLPGAEQCWSTSATPGSGRVS